MPDQTVPQELWVRKIQDRLGSLEEIRDEHQRQILELGSLIGALQGTVLQMVDTIGTQQRMISTLIDEYERTVGEIPPSLQQQIDDELAARRGEPG